MICFKCYIDKDSIFFDSRYLQGNEELYPVCKKCIDDAEKQFKKAQLNFIRIKKYGITEDDYNQLFRNQSGCCAICKTHESDLINKKMLFIDHDHKTGRVRGLLCNSCNTMIGLGKEDKQILLNAIEYIKSNSGP